MTQIYAHRGARAIAPENTLPAFQAALDVGAAGIELDVQCSQDGELVVMHDFSVDRTTNGSGKVADFTVAELRLLDAGSYFAPDFAGTRIPTLGEVIDAAGDQIGLNIELKASGPPARLVERTLAVIDAKGFSGRCVISSLSYDALAEVRERTRTIPIGYIMAKAVGRPTRLDVDFLSVQESLATRKLVRNAHRAGMQVHVWTVNSAESFDRMIDAGVDNVITDRPEALRARLGEIRALSPAQRVLLMFRNRVRS